MSNMVINTNVMALNSHRALKNVGNAQSKASARLSSGLKINSAADDAAGLAISEKMRAQIRGLDMASKNAQDAISMIQTAEGGMQEIDNMTQRIRELIVQASSDSNDFSTKDRQKIQGEISQLLLEIDDMADRVEFNNKKLINGTYSTTNLKTDASGNPVKGDATGAAGTNRSYSGLHIQVGANAGQKLEFTIGSMSTGSLGLSGLKTGTAIASGVVGYTGSSTGVNILDARKISDMIKVANDAVNQIANERAKLGAIQNRLEYTIKSLDISSENLSASESRIRDTDMAKEMMNLTKANVLNQAATSMLAQANQQPNNVLQLLG